MLIPGAAMIRVVPLCSLGAGAIEANRLPFRRHDHGRCHTDSGCQLTGIGMVGSRVEARDVIVLTKVNGDHSYRRPTDAPITNELGTFVI